MVDFIFNKSVHEQFEAFDSGFHKVTGGQVLVSFLFHCLCWSKINQSWNLIKFLVQHWSVWWLLFIYFFFFAKGQRFFSALSATAPFEIQCYGFCSRCSTHKNYRAWLLGTKTMTGKIYRRWVKGHSERCKNYIPRNEEQHYHQIVSEPFAELCLQRRLLHETPDDSAVLGGIQRAVSRTEEKVLEWVSPQSTFQAATKAFNKQFFHFLRDSFVLCRVSNWLW